MKKKVLGIALLAMSFVGFSAAAQTPATNAPAQQETVRKGDRQGRKAQVNPFEGMNLSDAQQAQLKQLNEKRQAERQARKQTRKDEKQRNESARMAERRNEKKSYLDQVKAIVGPEQYVVFLENFYVSGGNKAAMGNKQGGKNVKSKDGRKGHGDRKGNRNHAHSFNKAAGNVANNAPASKS